MQQDWWEDFFKSPDWLRVQRSVHPHEQTALQAEAVVELLELVAGDIVLDAPCGEGRIALELAARGMIVTGVDRSPELLEDANLLAAEAGVPLTTDMRDLRDIEFEAAFDAAICFWGSFGYFGPEGDRLFAAAIARALTPGGRWLIDTHTTETLFPIWAAKSWWSVDPLVLESRRYDHATGIIDTEWTFVRADGQRNTLHSHIRLYSAAELTTLLLEAGFRDVALYGDMYGEPLEIGSPRCVIVATR